MKGMRVGMIIIFKSKHFIHVHFIRGMLLLLMLIVMIMMTSGNGGIGGTTMSMSMSMRMRRSMMLRLRRIRSGSRGRGSRSGVEIDPSNALKLRRHDIDAVTQKLPHDGRLPRRGNGQDLGEPFLRSVAGLDDEVHVHGSIVLANAVAIRIICSCSSAVAQLLGQGGTGSAMKQSRESIVHGLEIDMVSNHGPRLNGLGDGNGVDDVRRVLEDGVGGGGDGYREAVGRCLLLMPMLLMLLIATGGHDDV